jgi:hypothetical protein
MVSSGSVFGVRGGCRPANEERQVFLEFLRLPAQQLELNVRHSIINIGAPDRT